MLFSSEEVAALINSEFVAGWENVRDVPTIEIDFGGGRRLTRTINGNIATYLCAPDGRVFDIIPGLYDAPTYLARLREGLKLYRGARETGRFEEAVTAYHRSRLAGAGTLEADEARAMMSKSRVEAPLKRALEARMEPRTMGKSAVEMPVLRAVVTDHSDLEFVADAGIEDADANYNESKRTPKARRLLTEALPTVAECFKTVYRDILGTDLDDPWLGLAPEGIGGEIGRTEPAADPAADPRSTIDVVFAIDCSGSMGALIDTAKRKVWTIVEDIAKAKPTPRLRIGLIGYGNADRTHRFFGLSDDLDAVYENLVTFKDEGWGDEWVGLAIRKATAEMEWSDDPDALKLIFVFGNETAEQGTPSYKVSAPEAIARGIMVNGVYCGGDDATWREFAGLADGLYTTIDASGGAVTIETPFDKELADLTAKVNTTYLPYGADGREAAENQTAQDENSLSNGGYSNMASRAAGKNWAGYNCERWDLVDAMKSKEFNLDEVKAETLPEAMRSMTLDERRAHIEAKAKEREAIQKQVAELLVKRQKHIDAELAKLGSDHERAFDAIVRKMIRQQAATKAIVFE